MFLINVKNLLEAPDIMFHMHLTSYSLFRVLKNDN